MSKLNDEMLKLFEPQSMPDADELFDNMDGTNVLNDIDEVVEDDNLTNDDLSSICEDDDVNNQTLNEDESSEANDDTDDESSIVQKQLSNNRTSKEALESQIAINEQLFALHLLLQKIITQTNRIVYHDNIDQEKQDQLKNKINQIRKHLKDIRMEACTHPDVEISSKSSNNQLIEQFNEHKDKRDNILQNWYNKTRSGSFSMLEQTTVRNIEQALANKSTLIRKTQLKRFKESIIGKDEKMEQNTDDRQYYEEIFDDNDFFYTLFERSNWKTRIGVASTAIQRSKLKSNKTHFKGKGKTLKYDIHPKLVNFYCPKPEQQQTKSDIDRQALLDAIKNG